MNTSFTRQTTVSMFIVPQHHCMSYPPVLFLWNWDFCCTAWHVCLNTNSNGTSDLLLSKIKFHISYFYYTDNINNPVEEEKSKKIFQDCLNTVKSKYETTLKPLHFPWNIPVTKMCLTSIEHLGTAGGFWLACICTLTRFKKHAMLHFKSFSQIIWSLLASE